MASSEHRVVSRLGDVLDERNMTLTELSRRTGLTMANLSILKNNHARAIRFSTLTLVCEALDCRPGDLLDLDRA
ncbi:helix-turn-helix domain-containing protein [uncultured Serinicoccus sp.]|uniref:helix-turn-helix domain-containing protein n=1 Tax=uncultured Serinicoccus sp. TaxID=735514 RepID=UPI00262111BA|nr:helix-turn-helix domain-containing protein [uncultured Serinicoccus sp.]